MIRTAGERKHEIKIFEGIFAHQLVVDLQEVDCGCCGRRRLLEMWGQRLRLVAGLHLDDVRNVVWIEKLGAKPSRRKLCGGAEHLLDAGRRLAV
jgi:hypothetical protein